MEELSLPEVHPLPPEGTAAGRTGPSRGHLDGGISDRLTYTSIYQGEHGGIWGRHRPSKRGKGRCPKGKQPRAVAEQKPAGLPRRKVADLKHSAAGRRAAGSRRRV